MEPIHIRYNNIWANNLIRSSLQVAAITAACALLTKFAMKEAQRLTKWNFEPFQGNVPPNLAFGTLFIAYISFGLRATKVHPLKNVHQFLTDILNTETTVFDDTTIEKNMVQYGDKDAILRQLNATRYNFITLNGAAITVEQGKDSTAGDQLFEFLTGEPHNLSEERAVRVLNQLEVQAFAGSVEEIRTFFRQILPSANILPDATCSKTCDLSVSENSFDIKFIGSMRILEDTNLLALFSLTLNFSFPKDAAAQETASYTWKITTVKNLIN